MDKLKDKHPSRPFNPDIANAFFRTGMIEAWGRGIERIMDACRAAAIPEPLIRCEQGGLRVELSFLKNQAMSDTQETTQEKILELLRARPSITRKELSARIGISADGIKYRLEKMKDGGIIRHIGPTKTGRWGVLK